MPVNPGTAQRNALWEAIDNAPAAGLLVAVVGPGGCGKTPLLDEAARRYAEAGVRLATEPPNSDGPSATDAGDAALLIDDAHLLDGPTLARLRRIAATPGGRLIVAHRRWPANAELTALGATLTARRAPIVLGHLDLAATGERVSGLLGESSPDALTEMLHTQTAGLPALLDQLVIGLRDSGQLDLDRLRTPQPHARLDTPAGLREQLRYLLDSVPTVVRQVLLAAALGAGSDTDALSELLDIDPDAAGEALQAAAATGLLTDDGAAVPLVGRLLLRATPIAHTNRMREKLAATRLRRGGQIRTLGRDLLGTGATGPNVAAAFAAAGDETLDTAPEQAVELYSAAVTAGATPRSLLARQAEAAARNGQFDEAIRMADEVLRIPDAAGRAGAMRTMATVLAYRGQLGSAAELYRTAAAEGDAEHAVLGVPALIGTGALTEAREVLTRSGAAGGAQALLLGAASLTAQGVAESIGGSAVHAVSQLSQAASMLIPTSSRTVLPDTPTALAALVAMHAGEFTAADSVLRRALSAGPAGTAAATRHTTLLAFLAMQRGHSDEARNLLAAISTPLQPRDELFAAATRVGQARRDGDLSALRRAWPRARDAIVHHPVNLYMLLPLGELAVVAARLGEQRWTAPHLGRAEELLSGLGSPVVWRVSLHWYGLHAAIAAESPAEAGRHASALAEDASRSGYAGVLAAAAACWLEMLAESARAVDVVTVAHRLNSVGLGGEGARLAGQAAARTTDRRAMTTLLECARTLRPGATSDSPGTGTAPGESARNTERQAPAGAPARRAAAAVKVPAPRRREDAQAVELSDREREIAKLVLTGMTYREIGTQLFISAKTVEHHMARMRRRLGATSRRDLFGTLRTMLGQDT